MESMESKLERLRMLLKQTGGIVIGYSGGVDSTFLAAVASEILGERALCVLASSETYPASEVEEALALADSLKLRVVPIDTDELQNEAFAANTPDRCFFCKTELFGKLIEIAKAQAIPCVADGANIDDLDDYRPGSRAAAELGVRSPLRECGLTKKEIRELSRRMGLPTWNKPSFACLSSRIPYGTRIEPPILRRLDEGERFLKELGFRQVRVRHHGDIARIEVEPDQIVRLVSPGIRERVAEKFKELEYLYATADLGGYRMGSMNAPLNRERKA
ncbi:MAG: ATP-dependent sacrificial sulfur transferase LarE [Thermodesulfobacteriota bacterium]